MKKRRNKSNGYPWRDYLVAWQVFRKISDEDKRTAAHLLNHQFWPNNRELTIFDIGCGDGRIVDGILKNHPAKLHRIGKVVFLEPNQSVLSNAVRAVSNDLKECEAINSVVSDFKVWPAKAHGAHVIFAIHVVYLLSEEELLSLLSLRPKNAVLFVILDSPTSVFTDLWSITAKEYHQRALTAHKLLQDKEFGAPILTTIDANFKRSELDKHPNRDWLLSLLCYRDMRSKYVSKKIQQSVDEIIARHTDATGSEVKCQSYCYAFPPT